MSRRFLVILFALFIVGGYLVGDAAADLYGIWSYNTPLPTGFTGVTDSFGPADHKVTYSWGTDPFANLGNADYMLWSFALPFEVAAGGANINSAYFNIDAFDTLGNSPATMNIDGIDLGTWQREGGSDFGWTAYNIQAMDFNIFSDEMVALKVYYPGSSGPGGDGDFGVRKFQFFVDYTPVPEPATMLLLGSGLVGLAGFRRKFRKS